MDVLIFIALANVAAGASAGWIRCARKLAATYDALQAAVLERDAEHRRYQRAMLERDAVQAELTRLTDRDARGRFVRREPKP